MDTTERIRTFAVRLASHFWVRCHVWPETGDAPHSAEGDAAYFIAADSPRKLGDIHFGSRFLDLETITHEAYHAIAELRRRVYGAHTFEGEEWCAQQQERLVMGIIRELRTR